MTNCTELRAVLSAPALSCLSSAVPDTDSRGGPLSKVQSCLPVSLSTATTLPSRRLTSKDSLQILKKTVRIERVQNVDIDKCRALRQLLRGIVL